MVDPFMKNLPVDISGTVMGESIDCLGTQAVVGENPKLAVLWHSPILVSVKAVQLWSNTIAME